ncbi:MAG TPA: hypothetical protein VF796_06200 [Humisphaera sp.]
MYFDRTGMGDPNLAQPVGSREVVLTAPFEVVDDPLVAGPQWLERPASAEGILKAIEVTNSVRSSGFDAKPVVTIELDHVPEDVAFDVIAAARGQEFTLGTVRATKNSMAQPFELPADALLEAGVEDYDLVFRSSLAAATTAPPGGWAQQISRKQPWLVQPPPVYSVWRGELRLPALKFNRMHGMSYRLAGRAAAARLRREASLGPAATPATTRTAPAP